MISDKVIKQLAGVFAFLRASLSFKTVARASSVDGKYPNKPEARDFPLIGIGELAPIG
jgi:hypothetical protein